MASGTLESSPKNTYAVLAGKLFACSPTQNAVYYLELKQVYDIMLECRCVKATDAQMQQNVNSGGQQNDVQENYAGMHFSPSFQHDLTLTRILKGANFIFPHNGTLLVLNATRMTRVTTLYIDRAWYYSVRCCHWHNMECNSSDLTNGCWLSMPAGGTGIVEFSSSWRGWGHVKINEVTTHEVAI